MIRIVLWALLAAPFLPAAPAAAVTVRDVAGRTVTVEAPVRRMVLGEGRQLYIIAALDREDPAGRIVGWRNDLIEADPASWEAYRTRFPAFAGIPAFSGLEQSLIDIETTVSQKPDVVVLNLETRRATEETDYVGTLAALGIPVVYVDFRHAPETNTEPSIRLFGTLLGRERRAEELIRFRRTQLERVSARLAAARPERPAVFVERAGGFYDECCHSFGAANFGAMVTLAGGRNVAEPFIPGTFGQVNPEQVIVSDPAHVVVTSARWDAYVPGGAWIPVGPGGDGPAIRRKLAAYLDHPAYSGTTAQRHRRFHAVWHQFYNSPYQFVAVQQMAKWFHPDLFADLDPEATFRELHERFLPIPYRPGYFGSLEPRP
ncbi:ABC transporter substrate-binding protein [Azospirillum sp. ST 5-10]|uniref:ABC transporter substrate-binding protein n=1 Tax=unclassified Azospirillum TaxID=2630922 RepID=UPI003F4A48CA